LYKPTICFIVYVAYEQKEIEKLNANVNRQQQDIQQLKQELQMVQQQNTDTDTDIGMIVYYYTIYTTLFLKNK